MKLDAERFTAISKALADPKRFEMLKRIASSQEAPTCSCLRDSLKLAPATITHHLQELEGAGLVSVERAGKYVHVTLRRDVFNAYVDRLSKL